MTSIGFAKALGSQAAALTFLAGLAQKNPELPPAYIVFSSVDPDVVRVQLDNMQAVETWREALFVPTTSVALETYGSNQQLTFEAVVNNIRIDVWAPFTNTQPESQPEGATA
ncbi:hypothetical protein [Streptomyces caniscabiei]|uniref:hypothetical protein n=1 Tax=Streptomyces caniscabiei TaxID=2746961 RepID=UPI0018724EFC|nr:hypothetical protein [Streptomyces caniscabiei]MBE4783962.1 hypothetical protein [Streptomyces caniscabiei]MBE4791539.1 hypothetical protein [Streptomyces caniscabiei]MDX3009224.1 hypothetical protein [Streptomyces caniscabiei]